MLCHLCVVLRVSHYQIWPCADTLFFYASGLLWVQQSGGDKSERILLWCTRPFLSKPNGTFQEQERPYWSSFGWAFTSHKGELSTLSLSCEVCFWPLVLFFLIFFPLCSALFFSLFHLFTTHSLPLHLLISYLPLYVLHVKLCFKHTWGSLLTVTSTVCCIQCPLSPRQMSQQTFAVFAFEGCQSSWEMILLPSSKHAL